MTEPVAPSSPSYLPFSSITVEGSYGGGLGCDDNDEQWLHWRLRLCPDIEQFVRLSPNRTGEGGASAESRGRFEEESLNSSSYSC